MTKKDREKIAKVFNKAKDWKEFALEEYKAGEEKKKKEEKRSKAI